MFFKMPFLILFLLLVQNHWGPCRMKKFSEKSNAPSRPTFCFKLTNKQPGTSTILKPDFPFKKKQNKQRVWAQFLGWTWVWKVAIFIVYFTHFCCNSFNWSFVTFPRHPDAKCICPIAKTFPIFSVYREFLETKKIAIEILAQVM